MSIVNDFAGWLESSEGKQAIEECVLEPLDPQSQKFVTVDTTLTEEKLDLFIEKLWQAFRRTELTEEIGNETRRKMGLKPVARRFPLA